MNRLNFMKMVNKNIYNNGEHNGENKFFNSTEIVLSDYYDAERFNRKMELNRKQHIDEKVNHIMAQVHYQLNNRKPSVPKPVIKIEKPKEKSPERVQKKKKRVTMSDEQHQGNSTVVENSDNKATVVENTDKKEKSSIPRLKAMCCRKAQKRMQQTIPPSNKFTAEKRVQDVLNHNAILEDMLEEHKQLRQDRQSIAKEITVMRGNLDGIRGRIKSSIKKLDDKKTYCELHGLTSCKSCRKSSLLPKKEETKLSAI